MKTEYKVGGRVQISGKWYEVKHSHLPCGSALVTIGNSTLLAYTLSDVIQAYEPPKKEAIVHEWLDKRDIMCIKAEVEETGSDDDYVANKFLTELYGAPPIVRTYSGEKPEEFGLKNDDCVLFWGERFWEWCAFYGLDHGDKWMLQPPAPKEDD